MKQALVSIFIILLLVSCKERINSVQGILNALAPNEQKSTIDPTVDNLIKGERGTQVFIPANALKFKDGTIPSGKANITLKEFFSISDFVSNRLSTMSDSFLLETGGMLFISATADGKELVVDSDKSYTIAFPKSDSPKKMELFYGDSAGTGNVNWQPAFRGMEGIPDTTLTDSALYENKITVCGYTSGVNNDTVLWHLNHPDSTIFRYVENNFKPSDTALINSLCQRGEMPGMVIEIDEKGKISDVNFKPYDKFFNSTRGELRKPITDFLYTIPSFKMESMAKGQGRYVGLILCCHNTFDWEKYKERFDKKYSQYLDKAIQKIDPTELKFYIMSATKFGWINCDRFYYDENIEKIDYIVKAPDTKDTKVMIVFDSIRSIMDGDRGDNGFVFKNVPNSSKIKVIGISFKDGKPMLSKTSALINKQPFTLSGFKEFTLKELEKELNN